MSGISNFVVRFREHMDDPVYESGVDPNSVVDTIEDIRRVYLGLTTFVRLPRPLDGIPPADTMKFDLAIDLEVRPLFSGDTRAPVATRHRRALSYTKASDASPVESPKAKKRGSLATIGGSKVTVEIDDALQGLEQLHMTQSEVNVDDVVPVSHEASKPVRRRVALTRN
jgi:hypothetical protein